MKTLSSLGKKVKAELLRIHGDISNIDDILTKAISSLELPLKLDTPITNEMEFNLSEYNSDLFWDILIASDNVINDINAKLARRSGEEEDPDPDQYRGKGAIYESVVHLDISQYGTHIANFMEYMKRHIFIYDWENIANNTKLNKNCVSYRLEFTWAQLDEINQEFNEEDYMKDLDVLDERIHNWLQDAWQRYTQSR